MRIDPFDRMTPDSPRDHRSAAQRDRDRILYTTAFRRLAEVTQVASATEGFVFHNRLTHTLEVAQIARRIAEKLIQDYSTDQIEGLGGLDADVAEAAALAHDLGHPPFGHIAESEMHSQLEEWFKEGKIALGDGFEGNAQSFRIVTKLAVRRKDAIGLNLTRATLNAILKYPWIHQPGKTKWAVYQSERAVFDWVREIDHTDRKSLEAEIMDWADDIAYSIHDVDDFYRAGIIPLDQIVRVNTNEGDRFRDYLGRRYFEDKALDDFTWRDISTALEDIAYLFPVIEPYRGTRDQRGELRQASSGQITRYIGALTLADPQDGQGRRIHIDATTRMEVAIIKELTKYYVIYNPSLATQQSGQRKVIRTLLQTYMDEAFSASWAIFPESYRERLKAAKKAKDDYELARTVVDLIASMTEAQALQMFHRMTGTALGSILDSFR
jgi:dGTPase